MTEIAIAGRSLPKFAIAGRRLSEIARVFDGKMCDVGQHHRPRAAFPLLAFGSTGAPERRRLAAAAPLSLASTLRCADEGVVTNKAVKQVALGIVPKAHALSEAFGVTGVDDAEKTAPAISLD